MPTEIAAQPATPIRSRLLAFSLGFLIIMLAVQPAFSATIQTDLWVYQQGDTVTVTGADYGAGETVEIVTTDPNGVEVDRGSASANELGGFTYQFVLMSDVPGIYDVIGTGLVSGLVAATQFDPPSFSHSVNSPSPATVQYSDSVSFSGSFNCVNGGGSNPNCPTSAITATATVALRSGGGGFNDVATVTTTFTFASTAAGCPTQCTSPWSVSWQSGRNLAAATVSPGTYDVRVTVTSSTNFGAQQTLNSALTVNKEGTTTAYSGPASGTASTALALSATVADADGGAGSANGRFLPDANLTGANVVQFQLFNSTNTTAVSGVVSANLNDNGATSGSPSLTLPAAPGTYQLRTTYVGNAHYETSADLDAITVNSADAAPPVVTLTLPTPPAGQDGYFNGSQVPVTGSVSATDPSGVTAIDCTDSAGGITLGPLTSNSRTVSINGNGTHDISCTATDGLGTSGAASGSSNTATVKIDVNAPTVTATPSRGPDSNGWYNSPFMVQFSGVDVGPSGGVACAADVNYSGPDTGADSITRSCSDAAGNSASATFNFKYDGTGPGATATPDRPADHAGWYNAPVTVTFAATGSDLSDSVVCDPPETYTGPDGEDVSVSGVCTDAAGNPTTATFTFDFDDTDPLVTVSPDRDPDHNGWYNAPVDFTTKGDDDTSGIDTCSVLQTYTTPDGEDLVVSGSCTDKAGNSASADSEAFDFDNTDPTITFLSRLPAANGNGWNNSAVTVTWTCADTTSGPVSATVSTPKPAEGDGQFASNHCEDNAGNASGTATVSDIRIDLTDPTITFDGQSPAANASGWNNSAVTLDWTCTDGLSGPVAPGDSEILSSEGANQSATGTCTDLADNSASDTQIDIDIDTTGPTITFDGQTPAANAFGWNNTAVTLTWTCGDLLSGPAAANDSITLPTEGANQSVTGTCTDLADNSASDTQNDIDIDLTKPNVAITLPADGLSTIALTVAVDGTMSDDLSGIDSVNVNSLPATLGSTSFAVGAVPLSCGSNEVKATAVDKAGNSQIHTIHVTRVCFTTVQYYAPLDQSTSAMAHPVTNNGKIGRVIPTKVTFKLDDGTAVTDSVAAARGWTIQIGVNGADCDNGSSTDAVEAYADAGQSSAGTNLFRWTSGQWMYNLDTNKPPVPASMVANKCYRLDVYVHDGTNKVKISTDTYAIFKPTK